MKQTTNHQNPNFEQLPMQINVKIYRPSVTGASPSAGSR